MPERAKTAVVAEPFEAHRDRLAQMLKAAGFSQVFAFDDALDALQGVQACLPDALIASVALRPSDGAWLAQAVLDLPLPVRPAIVLLQVPGMFLPHAGALRAAGVEVVNRPVSQPELLAALRKTDIAVRRLPEAFVRKRDALLDRLGVTGHEGRAFLETAVALAWLDARLTRRLTTALYPMVGRLHGVSARKVERSMRYAIELAWKRGRIDEQYRIFRGTIDAQRGKPTCGEMIAQLADILRMEEI